MSPPFTVYLTTRDSICSGVILNETTILTAGHCLYEAKDVQVYAGVVHKSNLTKPLSIASMHICPGYNNEHLTNDIAIIKLARPLVFNKFVHAVEPYYSYVKKGSDAYVTGWGVQRDGKLTKQVRSLKVYVYDDADCISKYGSDYHGDKQICAGTLKQDFCIGDSGGPLILYDPDPYLIGIVSYTGPQCSDSRPSVYTKITAYRQFIDQYI